MISGQIEDVVSGAEWEAVIRGRQVTCRWIDGRFDGDWEVLARLEVLPDGGRADTLDQARRLIACVLLEPTERPLDPLDRVA